MRPWRHQCWIFPRDPHFLELAGPVLDLYACRWQGRPLWADEYVLSADEKTSIQARRRLQPTLPPGAYQAVEHEYGRQGTVQYLAAWDVHRAMVFGRCEPKDRAKRRSVGSSTRSWTRSRIVRHAACSGSSTTAHPIVVSVPPNNSAHVTHGSSWCIRQCMRVGSIKSGNISQILQRKVLTPNDLTSLKQLESASPHWSALLLTQQAIRLDVHPSGTGTAPT